MGRLGEGVAARFLRRRGLSILARNVRAGRGEVDLIAREGNTLVFVEVKSRSVGSRAGATGLENLGPRKLAALRRSCGRLLSRAPEGIVGYRLDAVTVELEPCWYGWRVREVHWYPAYQCFRE